MLSSFSTSLSLCHLFKDHFSPLKHVYAITDHSTSSCFPSVHRFSTVPSVHFHHDTKGQIPLPQDQEDSIQEGKAATARASSQEYRETCQQGDNAPCYPTLMRNGSLYLPFECVCEFVVFPFCVLFSSHWAVLCEIFPVSSHRVSSIMEAGSTSHIRISGPSVAFKSIRWFFQRIAEVLGALIFWLSQTSSETFNQLNQLLR